MSLSSASTHFSRVKNDSLDDSEKLIEIAKGLYQLAQGLEAKHRDIEAKLRHIEHDLKSRRG